MRDWLRNFWNRLLIFLFIWFCIGMGLAVLYLTGNLHF